jgi:hypothetical protein
MLTSWFSNNGGATRGEFKREANQLGLEKELEDVEAR